MKKLLLFIALLMGVSAVKAQLGIQAGAVFYSGKATADNVSFKYDTKVGFTAGVVYSAPLSTNFSFMPSLNFTQKGGKYTFEDGDDDKLTLSYIELPLNFVYNTSGKGGSFFIGAGPDLAVGVGGKEEFEGEKTDINFGSGDNDDFKPFEFSVNIIAGYKLDNGVFFAANYNPGISDIAPDNSGSKYHNMGFGIRIGYMFAKMKPQSASSDTQ
jgi:hypothetical protein